MIKGGIVLCSNMYQHNEETMRAINEMRIRGVASKFEFDIGWIWRAWRKKKESFRFCSL